MAGGFMELKNLPVKSRNDRLQAGRKSKREQDGKRREEEILPEGEKKTEPEEDNNFKSADLPQFKTAADIKYKKRPKAENRAIKDCDRHGFVHGAE